MFRSDDWIEALAKAEVYLIQCDAKGRIVEGARHLPLADPKEAKTVFDLVDGLIPEEQDREALRKSAREALSGKPVPLVRFFKTTADGREYPMILRFAPSKKGLAVMLLRFGPDHGVPIPEDVERMAGVGAIAASASHEFNNILTSILGWAQIAKRNPYHADTLSSALEIIESNARRARQIAYDLSGIASKDKEEQEIFPLSNTVEEVLRFLSWRLDRTGIEVSQEFASAGLVCGLSQRLYQVFFNLVLNAIEAMPNGGQLSVSVMDRAGAVEVLLADTGSGVPPELRERIFEPYFTTKKRSLDSGTGGTGLGLSLCKRIVEEHGGRISVESAEGGGALFRVSLPRADEPSALATKASRQGAAGDETAPGLQVLVVDDEEDIREMLRIALGLKGMNVTTAAEGEEASRILKEHRYDVVLIDYSMPGLPAEEVIRSARSRENHPAFVLLSGRAEVLEGSAVSAFDATLRKPFDVDEVFRTVRSVAGLGRKA